VLVLQLVVLVVLVWCWSCFAALVLGVGRNPTEKDTIFQYALLGFALTEAVGLLGLMMAFLFLFR